MDSRFIVAAVLAGLLAATPALSQTNASERPETSCNTASNTTIGSAGKTADTSMTMEKGAVLPDVGGEKKSAAPTVQNDDGKPMLVERDCPPEAKSR